MFSTGGPVVKNLPANVGDTGSNPGPGRFHMSQGNKAHVPQLVKPAAAAAKSLQLCPAAHQAPQAMGFSRQEY